jgi:hypothetical protein
VLGCCGFVPGRRRHLDASVDFCRWAGKRRVREAPLVDDNGTKMELFPTLQLWRLGDGLMGSGGGEVQFFRAP